jgi:large subunit ribosomal protein L17
MRHGNHNRKFGRETDQRAALAQVFCVLLCLRGRIQTTEAKAKEIRPAMEKLITKGKNPTIANRRLLISALGDAATAKKLIKTAEGYKTRAGGYTASLRWCSARATPHQWL